MAKKPFAQPDLDQTPAVGLQSLPAPAPAAGPLPDLDQAPTAGGSYIRQPDTGELKRVSGNDAAAEVPAAPADAPAIATPSTQE